MTLEVISGCINWTRLGKDPTGKMLPRSGSAFEAVHPHNRCSSESLASSSTQDRPVTTPAPVRARHTPRRKVRYYVAFPDHADLDFHVNRRRTVLSIGAAERFILCIIGIIPTDGQAQSCTLQIPRAAVKLEANTAVEEEHRARLEQIYGAGLQSFDGVDAPSRLRNLQQLYSVWNQSLAVQLKSAPPRNPKKSDSGGQKDGDFYANVGNAIRTLRLEIPMLFQEDFTCEASPPCIVWLLSLPC